MKGLSVITKKSRSQSKVLAWHFTNGKKLRDGQPLVFKKVYKYEGPLVMCQSGYHASIDIVDALRYAPGFFVSRVECSGKMKYAHDKMVCSERKALWGLDAKKIILEWAIRVATDAVKLVRETSKDEAWNKWADLWIGGEDRTSPSADAATYAADAVDADVAVAAAVAATYAAADAATYAADAVDAAVAAVAATYAAADAATVNATTAAYAVRKRALQKYSLWLTTAIEKARKV